MACCSEKAVKWSSFSVNFTLTFISIAPFINLALDYDLFETIEASVMLATAVVPISCCIYGYIAILKRHRIGLLIMSRFWTAVLIGVVLVTSWKVMDDHIQNQIHINDIRNAFLRYVSGNSTLEQVDHIQKTESCCGMYSYTDWDTYFSWSSDNSNVGSVPDSCCRHVGTGCGLGAFHDPESIYTRGCAVEVVKLSTIITVCKGIMDIALKIVAVALFRKYSKMIRQNDSSAPRYAFPDKPRFLPP